MIYRDFHGLKLSALGFGCMRFLDDPATGKTNQETVDRMFELAVENGVNYFDTAYVYLGGQSEVSMAKALSKYPRESYYLADKFPGHSLPGPVDNIALFNVSLERCGTDYFDFYLLHNVMEWSEKIYESEEYHIIPDVLKLKEEGKIRHLGFSCHGGPEMLEDFLNRHEGMFEFVQIQCNYLDWSLQDAKTKYDIITKHGLGVWVMEPCRGGKLANLSEENMEKLHRINPDASAASYAFRYLQELPNVKVILSGMNDLSQVQDNLNTFDHYVPLTQEEKNALDEIAESLKNGVPCTGCRYCCEGCPIGLNIPFLIDCYNTSKSGISLNASMRIDALPDDKKPAACIACGQCAHVCPQGIDVPSVLAELADIYESNPKWAEASKGRQESIRRDLNMN